jgi:hypothetical protein
MSDFSSEPAGLAEDAINTDNAFIGTVHRLVTNRSSATKPDLLLAAAGHAIRSGDKTLSEITVLVNQIWPGAMASENSVAEALALGRELNLVERKAALGIELWGLTVSGVDDVDRQVDWARAIRLRARQALGARAMVDLGKSPDDETLDLWLERLVRAIIQGVQRSQDAYFGRVEIEGNRLLPKGIELRHVYERLEDDRVDATTVDFLKASAVAAFDPMVPFGSELVSTITTGCVLHSYAAGRDNADLIRNLGSPVDQRALIDTPMLVDLVGPKRVRDSVQRLIESAVEAGWEVVVLEHSLEELAGLMEREIPTIREAFTRANAQGVKREWYASLAEGQLPSYCVEVLQDGTYSSLDEMAQAARDLGTLLGQLGVDVREHHNENDQGLVRRLQEALDLEIRARTGWRNAHSILRDAHSMAVMSRRRSRERTTKWPGGWIISPDRYMAAAYKRVVKKDGIPLTLSAARWGTLLSATVAPAEVVDLASAAAGQLLDEAMWLVPARFPSETALEIAKQLGASATATDMDVRLAQLSLDETLDASGIERSATSIAAEILNARVGRDTVVQRAHVSEAETAKSTAEREALVAKAAAESATRREEATARKASDLETKTEQLQLDLL